MSREQACLPLQRPDPGRTAFGLLLVRWNGLDAAGFAAWDFLPGMRFGERAAWWSAGGKRDVPHEGLDILYFRTADGRRRSVGAGARIPVVWPGEIVAVTPDFLGASVFVAHRDRDGEGRLLHTICGHLLPDPGLAAGSLLCKGDAIGTIAPGRPSGPPPHLHLTVALIDRTGGPQRLGWAAMRDATRVRLLDPLPILSGGWAAGEAG